MEKSTQAYHAGSEAGTATWPAGALKPFDGIVSFCRVRDVPT